MSVSSSIAAISVNWPASTRWWLKDPLNPAANMEISLQPGTFDTSATFPQQVVFTIGRVDPIVMGDTPKLPTITALPLRFLTDAQYQAFEGLRASGHVLLLQAPKEVGQWYVIMGATKSDSLNLLSVRQYLGSGFIVRDVTISAQVVSAP